MLGTELLSDVDDRYWPEIPLPSASWTPCQDDALKDRSSMPPVSVTMHALNEAADPLLEALLDAPAEDEDLLLPQPAASSASTLSAAAARTVCRTVTSFSERPAPPARAKAPAIRPSRRGHRDPKRPTLGCPQVRPGRASGEVSGPHGGLAVAKSKRGRPQP